MAFAKAIKRDAKGRVALVGPSGAGKSYTMLVLARLLAGPTGKIAAIDTEHGSLSKYADLFEFHSDEPKVTSADYFLKQLDEAERGGFDVFCCDSLSHFWMGAGGALEFVDEKAKASGRGDSFAGWKAFRPHERAMVDRMIASPCHVIVTMRTQTEYVEEMNERGKKVRRKIGLKPIQRDGLEYEFDLVGSMDEDNTLIVDKSRVMLADGSSPYQGKAFTKPSAKTFEAFQQWLKGAAAKTDPWVFLAIHAKDADDLNSIVSNWATIPKAVSDAVKEEAEKSAKRLGLIFDRSIMKWTVAAKPVTGNGTWSPATQDQIEEVESLLPASGLSFKDAVYGMRSASGGEIISVMQLSHDQATDIINKLRAASEQLQGAMP